MSPGIKIEAKADPGTIDSMSSAITSILMQGEMYHAEQETIRHAISVLGQSVGVNGTTISGCNFTAKTYTLTEDGE